MPDINPQKLAYQGLRSLTRETLPRHRQGEKFLKGPIPWVWLSKASALPGKSIHVAIAIWFLAGMKRSRAIKISPSILREMGVERNSVYRGLAQLKNAGLVSVIQHRGQSAQVTILEPE